MFFSRTSRSHLMQFKAEWDWHNLSGHFRWMISNDFSASQLANEGLCNMVKGNIAVVRQKEGGSCPLCSCKPWEGICHRKSMLPFAMCMECYLFQQEHRECRSIGDIYEMRWAITCQLPKLPLLVLSNCPIDSQNIFAPDMDLNFPFMEMNSEQVSFEGFQKNWGYPNSWMVSSGESH